MKKLLIASLIVLASTGSYAETKPATANADTVFAKANQLYEAKNYTEAFQEIQRIAATGNAQAIYNLGSMTQQGQGTAKDEKKAFQYFQDASNKGFGKASFELAQIYRHGNTSLAVSKNTQKYKELLLKASQQGSEEAKVEIATLYFAQGKPEYDRLAMQELRPLLQKDFYPALHVKALYDLSVGVKNKNPIMQQQAVNSFRQLATKGYIPSLMVLGNMMANGELVEQNLPEAKKIFTELAAQNVPQAKESLAKINEAMAAQKANPAPKK